MLDQEAPPANSPSRSNIQAALAALGFADACLNYDIQALPGSYSNFTHLLRVELAGAPPRQLVLRRYNPANYEAEHDKPICEFQALQRLRQHGIPVPPPLLLDETGATLGLPGIITEFVAGAAIEPPTEAQRWGAMAARTARMLARIHRTPFTEADKRLLMDDNVEVAWFIKDGTMPAWMRQHPAGSAVWQLVQAHWRQRAPAPTCFLHTDYWSGNILWQGDKISAVVDWEEAGYGDPAADVAYCRMEYYLEGLPEAADVFLRVYKEMTGYKLRNLPLFELAASARPMTDPAGWFTRPHMEERFYQFIAAAKSRLRARA